MLSTKIRSLLVTSTMAFLFASPPIAAQDLLHGTINSDQRIVLHGTGKQVVVLDFESALGLLLPAEPLNDEVDVSPWDVVLANSSTNVAFGTLGPAVEIDGSLVTKVGYAGLEPESDLVAVWGNDAEEILSLTVFNPEPTPEPIPSEFSGLLNADKKVVLVGSGEQVVAYEFMSTEGLLVPIPGDDDADASPFQQILANETTLVSVGTLGPAITIDGELTTPVGYLGSTPEQELVAFWAEEGSVELNRFIVSGPSCGPTGSLAGDVNGDGLVGFADFLVLSENFGDPGTFEQGDLDCNGEVAFADFLILSRGFGESSVSTTTVPEPSFSWVFALLWFTRRIWVRNQLVSAGHAPVQAMP